MPRKTFKHKNNRLLKNKKSLKHSKKNSSVARKMKGGSNKTIEKVEIKIYDNTLNPLSDIEISELDNLIKNNKPYKNVFKYFEKCIVLYFIDESKIMGLIMGEYDLHNNSITISNVEINDKYKNQGYCSKMLEQFILYIEIKYKNINKFELLDAGAIYVENRNNKSKSISLSCKCYIGTFTKLNYDSYNNNDQNVNLQTCYQKTMRGLTFIKKK